MIAARHLAEPELQGDDAAVAVYPAATGGDPVDVGVPTPVGTTVTPVTPAGAVEPAPAEPSRAELQAAVARLESDNAAMAAKIAALEAIPEERWVELKIAAFNSYLPSTAKEVKNANERMRRLIESKKVEAKKQDGRWFVDENGPKMRARLKQGFAWNAARGQSGVSSVSVG